MAVETNNFFDNLKDILTQFELPEDKVKNEEIRLERMRRRFEDNGMNNIGDRQAMNSAVLYAHGLSMFKGKNRNL